MSVLGTTNESQAVNVLSLFNSVAAPQMPDPLEVLLAEAYLPDQMEMAEEASILERRSELVLESQFPDQSMYVLDKQLQHLKESLNRIKFYLGDIDDLIPHKNL